MEILHTSIDIAPVHMAVAGFVLGAICLIALIATFEDGFAVIPLAGFIVSLYIGLSYSTDVRVTAIVHDTTALASQEYTIIEELGDDTYVLERPYDSETDGPALKMNRH